MSNQIVISSGAKVRNLSGVLTGTSGIVNSLGINVPDGIPQLDGSGKILVSQLPNSVMEYKGTWNAATNTPTLANGTGNAGDVYLCNVAGTTDFGAGPITFAVGDQVLYSGTTWEKASGATGTVTSVAVTESGDALTITGSPITTSGTINIGFAGTTGQYVNGAGGLTTFPSLTGYVPYTGATNDVDLGAFKLNAQSIHAKGTGGLGHLGLKHQSASATASANEASLFADSLGDLSWQNGNLYLSKFITSGNSAARSYTFPNASGTLALTSDLSAYVPYSGATTNVNIGNNLFTSSNIRVDGNGSSTFGYLGFKQFSGGSNGFNGYTSIFAQSTNYLGFSYSQGAGSSKTALFASDLISSNTTRIYNLPNADGTLALTSNLSSYLPLSGGTLTGQLNGTHIVLSGSITSNTLYTTNELYYLAPAGVTSLLTLYVAGALSGTSATFSTQLKVSNSTGTALDMLVLETGFSNPSGNKSIIWKDASNTLGRISVSYDAGTGSTMRFGSLYNGGYQSSDLLTIASSGAATFSSSVTAGGNVLVPAGSGLAWSGDASRIMTPEDNVSGALIQTPGIIRFNAGGSERMRITSSGNVGIGTSSPSYKLDIRNDVAASTSLDPISIGLYNGNDGGSAIYFRNSVGGQSKISFGVNSTGSGTDDTYLGFSIGGNTSLSERARFTSLGFFKASDNGSYGDLGGLYHELLNSNGGNNILAIKNTASSNPYGVDIAYTNSSPNNDSNNFIYAKDSTTPRFVVRANGGIANYQSNNTNLSDERTKKDISLLESYWDKFKAIEIVKFKYKDQTHDDFNIGVIAQQVESVAPEFVDVDSWNNKNIEDENNEEPLKSIYSTDLHHATIKVLQEAMAKIEVLEAKIKQLENK